MKCIVGLVALMGYAGLAQTPAGWQIVKDKKEYCQVAVPPDWTISGTKVYSVFAPDKTTSVEFASKPETEHYADIVKKWKTEKPAKVIESSSSRIWYEWVSPGHATTSWHIAINSTPVCEAIIGISDRTLVPKLKTVVDSFRAK